MLGNPERETEAAVEKVQNEDKALKEGSDDQQIVLATEENTQIQQVMTKEDGSPLLATGEDGTIYQVVGKNAEDQTILIAHGGKYGEQQCLLVASEDEQGVLHMLAGEQQEGGQEEQQQT